MSDPYSLFVPTDAAYSPSEGSGTPQIDLTDVLGCREVRARIWRLSPGDALVYHRHWEQEELYVCLDGPGQLHIDGERVTVPEGGVVRIPSETPRRLYNDGEDGGDDDSDNDGDREHRWLVVAAPPVERDGVHDVGKGPSLD